MTNRLTQQVEELCRVFDLPRATTPTLDFGRMPKLVDMLGEEFAELAEAVYGPAAGAVIKAAVRDAAALDDGTRDVVRAADALADVAVVDFCFATEAGIPLDDLLEEVHRSNLSKLDEDGRPVKDDAGKFVKGPNYRPPDVASILGITPMRQRATLRGSGDER